MNRIRKVAALTVAALLAFSGILPNMTALAAPRRLEIAPSFALPEARAGQEYNYQFHADGGLPPLTWHVIQGDLPQGLKLEPSGKLQWLLPRSHSEAYQFAVEVADASSPPQRFSQAFSLTVQPAPLRIVTEQRPVEPSLRITMTATPQPQATATQLAGSVSESRTVADSHDARITVPAVVQAAAPNATPTPTPTPTPIPCPSSTTSAYRVYGRLRPASLDAVIAQILRDPELSADVTRRPTAL
ncbi:MAG: putative Ig domain-containing protein [Acidobacteriota bacterium]|nr:putative Ig domain-containing protein [Acidobacteriota bacterium]